MKLELTGSKLNDIAGGNIDLHDCTGTENGLFARDIPGFLIQYTNDISISHFSVVHRPSIKWRTEFIQKAEPIFLR